MTDHASNQAAPEDQPAAGKLTAYRHPWTSDNPAWQLTTDLEPVTEAEMF